MNDRSNLYIIITAGGAGVCILILAIFAPAALPAQGPAIILLATGVIAVLQKSKETEEKVRTVAQDLAVTTEQTTQKLTAKINQASNKVSEVREVVNGQRDMLLQEIRTLREQLDITRSILAAERSAVVVVADPATKEAVAAVQREVLPPNV